MLRTRIATAVVLLSMMVAALLAESPVPFALLSLAVMATATWEWARLNHAAGAWPWLLAGAVVAVGAVAFAGGLRNSTPRLLWWLAAAVWLVGGLLALRGGPAGWPLLPRQARWVVGFFAMGAAWLALAHSRVIGVNFMLSVLCLVWAADIAAYFGGRAFGRRKLAPSISPGKSWEGVWSGMVGVVFVALLWLWLDRHYAFDSESLYTMLEESVGLPGMVLALLALAGFSVMGDLVESLVKRAAGAKDSSGLLPGHGGVLDRVDALLPVLPIALALAGP